MAARDSVRVRPSVESLEGRLVQSTVFPINSIGSSAGTITQPGEVTSASVTVAQQNLTPYKTTTIFGVFVTPADGSGIHPRIVGIEDAGVKIPFQQGRAFGQGGSDQAAAFVKLSRPGPLTVQVAGAQHTAGSYVLDVTLAGDLTGSGSVSPADLPLFAETYSSRFGQPNYNPAADFNQNGRVNLYDAMALMHNMPPQSPNKKLQAVIQLMPNEQTPSPTSANSGGQTYLKHVTIIGFTTPGSLILTDGKSQIYKFNGQAYYSGAKGFFAIPTVNTGGLNNNDFLFLDPFGRKLMQDYPIFWNAYARPNSRYR